VKSVVLSLRKSLPREFVTDHFDVDGLAHAKPNRANEVLINPRLQFAHPERSRVSTMKRVKGARSEFVRHSSVGLGILNRDGAAPTMRFLRGKG
jgi:hypothetical protein